jgi:hypothetical protein
MCDALPDDLVGVLWVLAPDRVDEPVGQFLIHARRL